MDWTRSTPPRLSARPNDRRPLTTTPWTHSVHRAHPRRPRGPSQHAPESRGGGRRSNHSSPPPPRGDTTTSSPTTPPTESLPSTVPANLKGSAALPEASRRISPGVRGTPFSKRTHSRRLFEISQAGLGARRGAPRDLRGGDFGERWRCRRFHGRWRR